MRRTTAAVEVNVGVWCNGCNGKEEGVLGVNGLPE